MYNVYQHWDPLKVCIVGRSYPPEFYSWIKDPKLRAIFETVAIETEEDLQSLIRLLQSFGVEVLRPDVESIATKDHTGFIKPPITPRDHMVMIGKILYSNIPCYDFQYFYFNCKSEDWPHCYSYDDIVNLPITIQERCIELHHDYVRSIQSTGYSKIFQYLLDNQNQIKTFLDPHITGPMVARIGKDLYFSTYNLHQDFTDLKAVVDKEFTSTRNHIVNTGGHGDSTFCPVCPGLIISLYDVPTYQNTFPGWEVIYLDQSNLKKNPKFAAAKQLTQGRWWIADVVHNSQLADIVKTYMHSWIGNVEETVFDVNMLIIDPKNVIVTSYNKVVFDALQRYGITAHIIPLRHKFFWDGGIHCLTNDLHRDGHMQDYFPIRASTNL